MQSYAGSSTGSPGATATATERPHVVLLASPGAGHLIPMAELARRLVEHHGFAATLVTFTNLSLPAHVLATRCQLPASVATALLPAVDIDDLPADVDIIQVFLELARRSLPNLRALLRSIVSSTAAAGPLTALVPDIFCSEALLVAGELGVPGYLFLASNLNWLALQRHLSELHRGLPPGEYRDFTKGLELPGGLSMRRADLPAVYRHAKGPAFPQLLEAARQCLCGDGWLVNTFDEMEPALMEAFKLAAEEGAFPPVFAVGPLVRHPKPEPHDGHVRDGASSSSCLEWLDRQLTGSVVYVSFGSGGALSLEQTTELAAGLEDSDQRLLWVVRMPTLTTSESDSDDPLAWLPEGFLERTAGRQGASPWRAAWAPQVRVLSHSATAAFVSHCGWNSALESVQSGVPMVTLPLVAEQRMNATVLEGKAGVALRPPAREDGVVVREEIAAAVKELLVRGGRGRAVRRRAEEMEQAAARAWLPGGSSRRALEEVATQWKVKAARGMEM